MASDNNKDLTASNLKEVLWSTMNDLQSGAIQPGQGDAIAAQAREILRTVRTQLMVTSQAKRAVPIDVISFAEK